ncbi:uncharacterized protein BO97DRAFT_402916 [Aspergillus homomorphus CBS 101889]|uniref:3-hydroxy-3-methylglutaryl coenzyme A reductase n=1 Tax=Aspergillus homomorphus (strain CBS 101889) TaxID=1450537 RepID=A0A395IED1_ASPHC|nr:hypothetical protein BO97DRAFT_402916 [Aspergillus homomorphus CBS 101889]RAL16524.1 hypothetical protein BO97DRAFT_402916 [Aspergillus homomorphus CBS 101889]
MAALPCADTGPSWFNKHIKPGILSLSKLASSHPVHTVTIVALLASSMYMSLLEDSLLDSARTVKKAEWSSLTQGSTTLYTGPGLDWKWQTGDAHPKLPADAEHFALLTLLFPDDASKSFPTTAAFPVPANLSVTSLPATFNSFSQSVQDHVLALSVPYSEAPDFLSMAKEIATNDPLREPSHGEGQMWIMKAARARARKQSDLTSWVRDTWVELVDLLRNAQVPDVVTMVFGYAFMHLTFASLFLSMHRMGSRFWLATSVLFSSTFAFVLGLFMSAELGVSINMALLSEGLPFLTVIVGFDKPIRYTRAVLSHSIDPSQTGTRKPKDSPSIIHPAIEMAIEEKGWELVKDYIIEIAIVMLGAMSGVKGGLEQFCFLAAWILFFDAVLLFSFYTAILCIKLEINQIKAHADMRRALEDDGISSPVAKHIATSHSKGHLGITVLGQQMRSIQIPRFKLFMLGGFLLLNVVSLCAVPFRSTHSLSNVSSWAHSLGNSMVTTPSVDPSKVASNGLDAIRDMARSRSHGVLVTILSPIRYELESPSVHYDVHQMDMTSFEERIFPSLGQLGAGGRMVGSLLKGLDDPIHCKWIVAVLALSIVLNGRLLSAARESVKTAGLVDEKQSERLNIPITSSKTDMAQSAAAPLSSTEAHVSIPGGGNLAQRGLQLAPVERTKEEKEILLRDKRVHELKDEEIVDLCLSGKLPGHALEKTLKDFTRAVKVRRAVVSRTQATKELTHNLEQCKLPYEHYDWSRVFGACCENVVGYMPVPVGLAGPLVIDGRSYFIPMATTEGVLVASASRGSKAINAGGGVVTILTADGMTRGPCVSFETLQRAGAAKDWLDSETGQVTIKKAFNSTTRFGRLQAITTAIAGTNLYIRFKTTTGDAMGMNMISKGVEHALEVMMTAGFEDMKIISLSANYCSDKKPAAINWIEGRGKSVVAEAIIPSDVVRSVLKTDVDTMVELNVAKNMIGSAMAGSIGGFNAHAANLVAAIFIATGQDPAQVVESANCITVMKNLHGSLQISVSMPSIEVGTLGGGTILEPQSAMLDTLGVRGPHPTSPGANSRQLARIVAAAVLAGELSLMGALAAGHLVRAHMQHNRSSQGGGGK